MTNTRLKLALLCGIALALVGCSNGTTASDSTASTLLSTTTATTSTTAATTSTVFAPGVGLYAGQSYTNPTGQTLYYGSDGNLAVYSNSGVILWTSLTSGKCYTGCYMIFQTDGNLVLYNGSSAYWSSRTATSQLGNDTATQLVFNSTAPFLQIEDASSVVLWSSSASN